MASLQDIIRNKSKDLSVPSRNEVGLEKGEIYFFSPAVNGNQSADFLNFCWEAPASGVAVIEAWGASGSGAMMCCCGNGLPGNPGAYSKKTIKVNSSSFVCGTLGCSSPGETTLCFRGCSCPTTLCYSGLNTGCICAMGGRGGETRCWTATIGATCCWLAAGFCASQSGNYCAGCGTVCNWCGALNWMACAYGGDVNKCGGISCTTFQNCDHINWCYQSFHVATSPGIFAEDGAVLTFNAGLDDGYSLGNAGNWHVLQNALSSSSRVPKEGIPFTPCYTGRVCGCWDWLGSTPYSPYGVPGMPGFPCTNQRGLGTRGGHGAVRIKFIGN